MLHFSPDYPFSNRAAIYGDGFFTTLSVDDGKAVLLSRHITRLQRASHTLQLQIDANDWQTLRHQIQVSANSLQNGIIKVLISAGMGGRGYLRSQDGDPHCYLQTLPPVVHYEGWRQSGIQVGVSPVKLALQPELSGTKHLNRLEQVLIKQQRSASEDDNALEDEIVLDRDNMIVEVSAGNLFWYAYGRWFTPDLYYSGVEGVMRNFIIDCLEKGMRQVNVVRSKLSGLHKATDAFVCNSLMKVVPVNKIVLPGNEPLSFNNTRVPEVQGIVINAIKLESE